MLAFGTFCIFYEYDSDSTLDHTAIPRKKKDLVAKEEVENDD